MVRKNKGMWTREEHGAFLRGLQQHGPNSNALTSVVPTRSALQIRTHCQKYFDKIEGGMEFPAKPYPSQYEVASGKSCIARGAYEYCAENQQDQEQQQQKQQQLQQQQHELQQQEQQEHRIIDFWNVTTAGIGENSFPGVIGSVQQWEHWNREQDELAAFAKWNLSHEDI